MAASDAVFQQPVKCSSEAAMDFPKCPARAVNQQTKADAEEI
jgi:hypothetical protein